jgi:ATP-dependent protease ClpP protease subunit
MAAANIDIVGQIGRDKDETVEAGITLLEIVPVVKAAMDAGAKELTLRILSPGGYLDQGNDIYNYFDSLKKAGIKINTTTLPDPATGRGLVGSIATKLFLVGDDRSIDPEKDDFFIHYPWMNPGPSDSGQLFDAANEALKAQEALTAFYCAVTKNTPEALTPFLDAETALTGKQAKEFGFATSFKKSTSNLLAKVKMTTANNKTLKEVFASLIGEITGKKPDANKGTEAYKLLAEKLKGKPYAAEVLALFDMGGKLKAQLKNKKGAIMADIAVTDQNGVGYVLDSDTITDLSQVMSSPTPVPIYLANPDGTPSATPAPDGDITTTDGNVITVSGGTVSNVKQSTDMENKALAAKIAALEKDNAEMKDGIKQMLEAFKANQTSTGALSAADVKKEVNDAIMVLKKEIGSNHVPMRTRAERNAKLKASIKNLSPVALKMRYPNGIPDDVKKILEED